MKSNRKAQRPGNMTRHLDKIVIPASYSPFHMKASFFEMRDADFISQTFQYKQTSHPSCIFWKKLAGFTRLEADERKSLTKMVNWVVKLDFNIPQKTNSQQVLEVSVSFLPALWNSQSPRFSWFYRDWMQTCWPKPMARRREPSR